MTTVEYRFSWLVSGSFETENGSQFDHDPNFNETELVSHSWFVSSKEKPGDFSHFLAPIFLKRPSSTMYHHPFFLMGSFTHKATR